MKRLFLFRSPFASAGSTHVPAVAAATPVVFALIVGGIMPAPVRAQTPAASPPLSPLAGRLLAEQTGADLLRGNGTTLGYVLTHGNVVPGSLSVQIDGVLLASGTGFTLDASAGALTLSRPARPDQTLVVRYRYLPGEAALSRPAGFAGTPLLTFNSSAFGGNNSVGAALGLTRTDDGGAAVPLLGLHTSTRDPGAGGLSGLLYLSTGAGSLGTSARSLVNEKGAKPATASGGAASHLIDQKLSLGKGRTNFSAAFQDVSNGFNSFAALKGAKVAGDADMARLQQEKGIQRLGLSGSVGLGKSGQISLSQNTLTAKGSGITRQAAALQTGGLSLSANLLRVDQNFSRFGDLGAEKDKDALEKFKGGSQFDLSGRWLLGRAFSVEGSLLDRTQNKNGQKNSRVALALAPARGWRMGVLAETAKKTDDKKTREVSTRALDLSTDPKAATSLSLATRQTTTREADGRAKTETLSRAGLSARLFGGPARAFGLSASGLFENTGLRESAASGDAKTALTTNTTTTAYSLTGDGTGPLRLRLDARQTQTDRNAAGGKRDPAGRRATRLFTADIGLRLGKSGLATFTSLSDVRSEGEKQQTENDKQDVRLTLGRGFLLRQSSETTATVDAKGVLFSQSTLLAQFATDPNAPLFASGERRTFTGEKDDSEKNEKWNGGLTLGGFSLRANGMGAQRSGTLAKVALAKEKNNGLSSHLSLGGDWKAVYTAFDRLNKDPQTKQDRDETQSEQSVSGTAPGGVVKVALASTTYDDRRDAAGETEKDEISVATVRPLDVGPLEKATVALTLGADRTSAKTTASAAGEPGTAAANAPAPAGPAPGAGRTRKVVLEGQLFRTGRLALEYGDRVAPGKPVVIGKGIRFVTDKKSRLQADVQLKVRPVPDAEGMNRQVVSRAITAAYRLARDQIITYRFSGNPEKPDGSVEKRAAEAIGYTAGLGQGAKLSGEYRTACDRTAKTSSRAFALSLTGPAAKAGAGGAAGTSYELSYLDEQITEGDKTGEMDTYVLAYQFQPDGGLTQIGLAARWIDRGGDLPAYKDARDEALAHVEIKLNW